MDKKILDRDRFIDSWKDEESNTDPCLFAVWSPYLRLMDICGEIKPLTVVVEKSRNGDASAVEWFVRYMQKINRLSHRIYDDPDVSEVHKRELREAKWVLTDCCRR